MLGIKARLNHARQPKAFQEQARADDGDHRKSYFRDNQERAQPLRCLPPVESRPNAFSTSLTLPSAP